MNIKVAEYRILELDIEYYISIPMPTSRTNTICYANGIIVYA